MCSVCHSKPLPEWLNPSNLSFLEVRNFETKILLKKCLVIFYSKILMRILEKYANRSILFESQHVSMLGPIFFYPNVRGNETFSSSFFTNIQIIYLGNINEKLLYKCERGNQIKPLWHKF